MNVYRIVLAYLQKKSDPYYEYGLERERVKPHLVRIKPWVNQNKEPKSLAKFREEHTATYEAREFKSISSYSYVGHRAINKTLRGRKLDAGDYDMGDGRSTDEEIKDHIDNLDSGMRRSPTKSPVVVWRGMHVFSAKRKDVFHPLEEKLTELGVVYKSNRGKEVDYAKALQLKGFTFTDTGFVSTSFNFHTAVAFTDKWSTPFVCQIKVPAGTQAIYVPGAHKLVTDYGEEDTRDIEPIIGEVELLLDRGLKFRVTNVTLTNVFKGLSLTGLIVHLDIVK